MEQRVAAVTAAPAAVFRLITDVDRLADWNRAIERVVERAPELAAGARDRSGPVRRGTGSAPAHDRCPWQCRR